MRTLLQVMVALVLLGLAGGWMLRSRVPRRSVPALIALAFLPLPVHAAYVAFWAHGSGLDAMWVAAYGAACLTIAVLGWWWAHRAASVRPFRAPLALPAAAMVQAIVTQVLGNAVQRFGVVLNPIPGIALFAAAVALAAVLVVVLPRRDPRPVGERGPVWWRALGRIGRR